MQTNWKCIVCLAVIAAAALPAAAAAGTFVLLGGGLTAAKLIFILFFLPIIVVTATLVIEMAGSCLFLMQNGRPGHPRPTVPKREPVGISLFGPHPHSPAH
jgi:hypothetical protein